jgi:xylulokinase
VSLVAIDIGSSRIKALLADWNGTIIGARSAQTPRRSAEPGEQAYPIELVYSAIEGLIGGLMDAYPGDRADTVVFSCLGTAMAPIDRDGRPIGMALAPSDARPSQGPGLGDSLDMPRAELQFRTGSDPAVPSFLLHALWWQREHPRLFARTHRFRSLRGYAVAELCGADVEDRAWASRTMLADLETGEWSADILDSAGLPASVLPPLDVPTTTYAIRATAIARLGLAPGALVVLGGMDNGCSLFGAEGPDRSGVTNIVGTYEHMAAAATLSQVRAVARETSAVVHAHVLPGRYLTMTRVPMGELLARIAMGQRGGLDELLSEVHDRPQGHAIALEPDVVAAALDAGQPRSAVLQQVIEAGASVLARFADSWDRVGLASSPVAVVGGGAAGEQVLRLKATILERPMVSLRQREAAGLGALRLAAMARRGLGPTEACALFQNGIAHTTQPRPARR